MTNAPAFCMEPSTSSKVWGSLGIVGATVAAAAFGALVSKPGLWYQTLIKPPGQPPPSVFGPVWTVLYAGIAYAGVRLVTSRPSRERNSALTWWGAQMALNAAWSPVFFGLHMPKASLAVIAVMLPTIACTILQARKVDKAAAALLAPYFVWTCYATYLNAGIVYKNL